MRFALHDYAVYWAPIAANQYGKPSVTTPVELPCRWEEKTSETINAEGETVLSGATVYLASDVLVGGYMMFGKLQDLGSGFPANPKADRRVREIINRERVPALHRSQVLVTAHLV